METGSVSMKTVEPALLKGEETAKSYEKPVSLEMEPDTVEFKGKGEEKHNTVDMLAKKVVAGTSGVAIAAPQITKLSKKASNWVAGSIKQIAEDFGKTINGVPKALPAAVKYGTILAGGLATFLLASKDSDNDGKLDILEGVGKLFQPGN